MKQMKNELGSSNELERRLQALTLVAPAKTYVARARAIVNAGSTFSGTWQLQFRQGLALVLILSLGINLLQFLQTDSAMQTGLDVDAYNSSALWQELVSEDLVKLAVDYRANSKMLGFLCLTKSSVVVDQRYYLGEISGFGEWLSIEIPELAQVSISLQPLRDWQPIGSYADGVMLIPLADGHELKLMGIGIGPTNTVSEGPFIVYGNTHLDGNISLAAVNGVVSNPVDGAMNRPGDVNPEVAVEAFPNTVTSNLSTASDALMDGQEAPLTIANAMFWVDSQLSSYEVKSYGALIDADVCG